MRFFLPAVALAAVLPAQDQGLDLAKTRSLFVATGDLLDIQWGFDAKRGLLLRPNPTMGGEKTDRLTPYQQDPSMSRVLSEFLMNSGATGFGAMTLFGDQDLVSHCFVDYHFRRMRLDRTPAGLRQRIAAAQPGEGQDARLHEIHRLMAVRIVERRRIASALPELQALVKERGVDLLLRWAAEDALAALTGKPVQQGRRATRFPSLEETLAAVPNDFDAILTIDYTKMPFVREISWFGRRVAIESSLRTVKRVGGDVSEAQFAGMQTISDIATITAFQLAYHVGNLRISRLTATIGARRGAKQPDSWARLDGHFDAPRILSLVKALGWKVDGELADPQDESGTILRVTNRFLEARSKNHEARKTGDRANALKQAGFGGNHVIFAQTGKLRRLSTLMSVPLSSYDGGVLTGTLTGGRKVDLCLRFPNRAPATGLMNLIQLGFKEMRGGMEVEAKRNGADPAKIEAMFFPQVELDDEEPEIRVRWDGSDLTLSGVLKAIGFPASPSRQDGPQR